MKTAVILAGGLGTRLKTVVSDVPKPMAPINGRPFLEYLMNYWIKQGINNFILAVGYKKEIIINHFNNEFKSATIEYVIENSPLGTGGGLVNVVRSIENLPETFLVINGDTFFEANLPRLYKLHYKHHADVTFSLFQSDTVGRYMGIFVNKKKIEYLIPDYEGTDGLKNGGVYIVQRNIFDNFDNNRNISFENDIICSMLQNNKKLCGIEFKSRFIDIGVPDDFKKAQSFLTTMDLL
jgi:D-glycero-alpha-D-manno-heptose 1-phosphate guanylyltransferase